MLRIPGVTRFADESGGHFRHVRVENVLLTTNVVRQVTEVDAAADEGVYSKMRVFGNAFFSCSIPSGDIRVPFT